MHNHLPDALAVLLYVLAFSLSPLVFVWVAAHRAERREEERDRTK